MMEGQLLLSFGIQHDVLPFYPVPTAHSLPLLFSSLTTASYRLRLFRVSRGWWGEQINQGRGELSNLPFEDFSNEISMSITFPSEGQLHRFLARRDENGSSAAYTLSYQALKVGASGVVYSMGVHCFLNREMNQNKGRCTLRSGVMETVAG
jgi:hypothetical protein